MSTGVASKSQKVQKPHLSNSLKSKYLVLYNFASALLWLVVLGRLIMLVPLVGFERVYDGEGKFTQFTQTLATLEIFHSLFGIVRAPVFTTGMQVASRLLLVWGVLEPFPSIANSPVYSSMLFAWSLTELIRYTFFVFSLNGYTPGILRWLRYNTFFVLYPLGISSECWLVSKATTHASKSNELWAWAYRICLLIYIPGTYVLYTHMISQRRKVIKGHKSS